MNAHPWTRRPFRLALAGAAVVLVAAGVLRPASAADGAAAPATPAVAADVPPETMILDLSTEVLDDIRNDKAIQAGDFGRVQKLVDERILPKVDFDKMTRLAVGRAWRGATAEQRSALTTQFRLLLMRTFWSDTFDSAPL